jgi:cbb3-type cytochrome oxidase subunit 1
MITTILLIATLLGFAVWKEAEIIVAGTYSFLLGVLYDREYYEDDNVIDHTFQIALICIVITFKWETYS